ncbi:uncharacterized protein LOC106151363 [Lingula anatina]|uniref:Uncharacterized protein LOC106151363 n=1 Tax=Lingula anatina TaxID=7574 RepID=A0A1S3H3J9_LINAN|nr:uncharacterized protein LOC106151363 [Lingula anatina]|eukprot:XP_013380051.1 uncharacterized protein LOC106151363 [Lingula anatina]
MAVLQRRICGKTVTLSRLLTWSTMAVVLVYFWISIALELKFTISMWVLNRRMRSFPVASNNSVTKTTAIQGVQNTSNPLLMGNAHQPAVDIFQGLSQDKNLANSGNPAPLSPNAQDLYAKILQFSQKSQTKENEGPQPVQNIGQSIQDPNGSPSMSGSSNTVLSKGIPPAGQPIQPYGQPLSQQQKSSFFGNQQNLNQMTNFNSEKSHSDIFGIKGLQFNSLSNLGKGTNEFLAKTTDFPQVYGQSKFGLNAPMSLNQQLQQIQQQQQQGNQDQFEQQPQQQFNNLDQLQQQQVPVYAPGGLAHVPLESILFPEQQPVQQPMDSQAPQQYQLEPMANSFPEVKRSSTISERSSSGIPAILHTIWNDQEVPSQFAPWMESWSETHPAWDRWFWVRDDFPKLLSMEPRYQGFTAMRTDALRMEMMKYLFMYLIGGVYIDLDVESFQPLDEYVNRYPCVLSQEPLPHAFLKNMGNGLASSAIMMCRPKHPFFRSVLEYYTSLNPAFLLRADTRLDSLYRTYLRNLPAGAPVEDQVYLADPEVFMPTLSAHLQDRVRDLCGGKLQTQIPTEKITSVCSQLEARDFKPEPLSSSVTNHHFANSWSEESKRILQYTKNINELLQNFEPVSEKMKKAGLNCISCQT